MIRLLAVFWCVLLVATPGWCWGEDGHSIVGEIAQRRLTPVAAAAVTELLGPGASLASVASWADDERARNAMTARWHFVDIPLAETAYDPARDCRLEADGDCIIAAIDRERATVACPAASDEDRQRALKFLVHFVGDLHQPFHTLLEQRGGTRIDVTVVTQEGVNGREPFNTHLHAVWDSALIEKTAWAWGSYMERVEVYLASIDEAAAAAGNSPAWAEESHAVVAQLYPDLPDNRVLDDSYRWRMLPIIDRQLGLGGIRLATLLNDVFAAGHC